MPQLTTRVVISCALAAVWTTPARADEPLSLDEGERLVRQLGDPSFKRREEAAALLIRAGLRAGPFLLQAVRGPDAEVAARARKVIERLQDRTPPGTPADVAALVKAYHDEPSWPKRHELAAGWAARGVAAFQALVNLSWEFPTLRQEKGEGASSWRMAAALDFGSFVTLHQGAVGRLLEVGRHDDAEKILEVCAPLTGPAGDYNHAADLLRKQYAHYLARRGTLDAAIARHRPWADRKDFVSAGILAPLLLAKGELAEAQRYAAVAADQALVRHARHARRQAGDWRGAAEAYHDAWKAGQIWPQFLFLSGWCLTQAGDVKEGERRMELAHWVPLGNDYGNFRFARSLAEAGFAADAMRVYEAAAGFTAEDDFSQAELKVLGQWHLAHGRYAPAADCFERVRRAYCESNLGYDPPGQYLVMSHRVHHARALGLLAAKRFDEAETAFALCRDLLPADVNLCVEAVPLLDRLGRKAQADRLFGAVYGAWAGLTKDYPRCALARHHLAWLAARCGRRQQEAVAHAEQAVKLKPAEWRYRDTLAELLFQFGRKAQAEALAQALHREHPHHGSARAQLTRIRAGDARAPLPYDPLLHHRGGTIVLRYSPTAEGPISIERCVTGDDGRNAPVSWD